MAVIELTTLVPAPAERVFDLSLDVDAHTASMAGTGERVVAASARALRGGDTVTWSARHFGLPWRMTVRITAYDRPQCFVDEQIAGPFRHWRHEHTFTGGAGGAVTVMRDVIDFAAPLGALGRLAGAVALRWYLRRLIGRRNAYLVRALGGGDGD